MRHRDKAHNVTVAAEDSTKLGVADADGCAFAGSPPALERRRICRPSAQNKASWRDQTSTPGDGSSQCVGVTFALGLKKRSFSKTAQMCAAHEQVRRAPESYSRAATPANAAGRRLPPA